MEFSLTFVHLFYLAVYLLTPILLLLCVIIVMLGQLVGKIENWGKFDTLYWSFITALTVGYGDIRPLKKRSKALAVIIALLGIMFTGVFVAITVESASRALNKHIDPNVIQSLEENSLQPFL